MEVIVIFFIYYLTLTNINKQLTGEWAYPIFTDLEKKYGYLMPYVFECVITFAFFGLSELCVALLRLGSVLNSP